MKLHLDILHNDDIVLLYLVQLFILTNTRVTQSKTTLTFPMIITKGATEILHNCPVKDGITNSNLNYYFFLNPLHCVELKVHHFLLRSEKPCGDL